MSKLAVIACVLLAACSKKADKQDQPAPPPPAPATKTAPGTAVGEAGRENATASWTCDQLLPQAVRDAHFKDKKVKSGQMTGGHNTQCLIGDDANPMSAGSTLVSCNDQIAAGMAAGIAKLKEGAPDAKDVTGIGKGGIMFAVGDMKQYTVWDDDSNCQINVSSMSGFDVEAVTKAIVAAIPAK